MKKISFIITLILFTACKNNKQEDNVKDTKIVNKKVVNLETFATTPESVGNISFTAAGDLVYSHHPLFEPKNRVMIMDAKTKESKPFPNKEWNTPRETDEDFLSNVLGIRNDKNGIVWMLDMAQRNAIKPKIVGWNTNTNTLEKIYYLDKSIVAYSQPNDMVVDTKHGVFIIADEGIGNGGNGDAGAFIIVDMKTGEDRRILEGHRTTKPENTPTIIDGKKLNIDGNITLVGNDGITSDKDFEWIYYGPLNGTKVYRIKTEDLLNYNLSDEELDSKIETYSSKPNNGGMSIDKEENIYMTAVESKSIVVVLSENQSTYTIAKNPNMVWPDGVSYNHIDGYMYVSAAQVNNGSIFNNGENMVTKPFYIFRFKPIVEGAPYR